MLRAVLGVGRGLTALSAVLAGGGGYLVLHFGGVAGLSAVFGGGGGAVLSAVLRGGIFAACLLTSTILKSVEETAAPQVKVSRESRALYRSK